jgi:ParB-like nuclease domain
MPKDAFDKFERDANRFDDEADRADEAGAKRRAQFAKQTKKTLAVTDIEIPNNYPPVTDYEKFLALVEDIRANDIQERIDVTERRGRYVIEHGRARLEAAKRLKHETIKVILLGAYKPAAVKKSKPRAPLPNEWELVQQARDGDLAAQNRLLDHYYWLAVSVAYKGRRKMHPA